MIEPSGPQKVLLSLQEYGSVRRSDIIEYYEQQGYTNPHTSASRNITKLISKKLIRRTRAKGIYVVLYNKQHK